MNKRFYLLIILSCFIISIDRILKIIIFRNIPSGSSYPIVKNILHITPTCNKGIAFGLFKGIDTSVFITVSFLTAAFISCVIFLKRPKSFMLLLGLFMILSGAIGNLIDRILYGYVLDFIDIRVWPIFNIADSSISLGTLIIIFKSVFQARPPAGEAGIPVLERRS